MVPVIFYTIGCRSNQAETRVLENLVTEKSGLNVTESLAEARIAVINTCTVTGRADRDARKLVARIVRTNPKTRVALIGCQAEIQKEKLTQWPGVQWVIGNARKMNLDEILTKTLDDEPRVIAPPIDAGRFTYKTFGTSRRHTRANLKIQDGCDSFCSYCIVPYARGRARSRVFRDIIKAGRGLAQAGHQEIVLTGINIGNYNDHGKNLIDVIVALEKIPALRRIRISSIEPQSIPDGLFDLMARSRKLCRHLHIPIQHGCDEILKSMKRQTSIEQFFALARGAERRVNGICLGTDIIVGFPGETEDHFTTMYRNLKKTPTHYFHVFSYSARPMTASYHFPRPVSPDVMARRSARLRRLSQQKRRAYYKTFCGSVQDVLFEQKKGAWWKGLTDNFIHVRLRSGHALGNRLVNVRLTRIEKTEAIGVAAE